MHNATVSQVLDPTSLYGFNAGPGPWSCTNSKGEPSTMSPTLALTADLLRRPSVSPEDHGCMDAIRARLEPLGFSNERLRFGPVANLWARRGNEGPVLCFAGHTDVVPTGPREDWRSDPFDPVGRRWACCMDVAQPT